MRATKPSTPSMNPSAVAVGGSPALAAVVGNGVLLLWWMAWWMAWGVMVVLARWLTQKAAKSNPVAQAWGSWAQRWAV